MLMFVSWDFYNEEYVIQGKFDKSDFSSEYADSNNVWMQVIFFILAFTFSIYFM